MKIVRSIFNHSYKRIDLGLLILRIGLGTMFFFHGFPKLLGGEERWFKVGEAVSYLGIEFGYLYWGLAAALSEIIGGIFFMLGFIFKSACVFLLITMIVAAASHLGKGNPFTSYSHPVEMAIVFFAFIMIGPGKHSLDNYLFSGKKKPDTIYNN